MLATVSACSLVSAAATAADTPDLIRLPAIIHKWGAEPDASIPETTIGEVSRCMGRKRQLGPEQQVLEQELSQLNVEATKNQSDKDQLAQERSQISEAQQRLAEEQRHITEKSVELDKQRRVIERARSTKSIDTAAAQKLNSLIKSFNQQVALHNEVIRELAMRVTLLGKRVDAFNISLARVNGVVIDFNQRASSLKTRLDGFEQLLLQYRRECEGERKLVK